MKILSKKDFIGRTPHRTPYISINAVGEIIFNPAAVREYSLEPGMSLLLGTDDNYPGKLFAQKTRIDDGRAWLVSKFGKGRLRCRVSIVLNRMGIDYENHIYTCTLAPAPEKLYLNWYILSFEKGKKRSRKK